MSRSRPSDRRGGDAGRLGDGVDHDPDQRALPQLATEQADEEPALVLGHPPVEGGEQVALLADRARTGGEGQVVDHRVDLGDLDGRLGGGGHVHTAERRPADADPALAGEPGQEPDGRTHLVRCQPTEQVGQRCGLRRPRRRRRHRR
jgi:hypothetical protein